ETGGLTFAIAWADLTDVGEARTALTQWKTASLASIRVPSSVGEALDFKLPGAGEFLGVQAQGLDHQGQALHMQALYFSHGGKVYQAGIYGATIAEAIGVTFFEGLSLP